MVNNSYPKYGEIIVIDFEPQIGVEMKKRRPAVVVSVDEFQKRTGLVWLVPITSNVRETFPLHVPVDESGTVGTIVCEQIKSFDYNARNWRRVGTASYEIMDRVRDVVFAILNF
ncbi:MAG: type II toxin-antitoxin system PemK/MazF family toxin [Phascolarctobacterium sp.]|nr:type II toxin-antitoxin system PemK/MazF family toxin [Phascolarctobacterium sp.]